VFGASNSRVTVGMSCVGLFYAPQGAARRICEKFHKLIEVVDRPLFARIPRSSCKALATAHKC